MFFLITLYLPIWFCLAPVLVNPALIVGFRLENEIVLALIQCLVDTNEKKF